MDYISFVFSLNREVLHPLDITLVTIQPTLKRWKMMLNLSKIKYQNKTYCSRIEKYYYTWNFSWHVSLIYKRVWTCLLLLLPWKTIYNNFSCNMHLDLLHSSKFNFDLFILLYWHFYVLQIFNNEVYWYIVTMFMYHVLYLKKQLVFVW